MFWSYLLPTPPPNSSRIDSQLPPNFKKNNPLTSICTTLIDKGVELSTGEWLAYQVLDP